MSGFIEWLEKLNENDSRVRAILRRSLAFDPGRYVSAFPYVEPYVKNEENSWRREMHYLVAGLWAMHWREGRGGTPMSIGKACAVFDNEKRNTMNKDERQKLSSTEKRFVALLDAVRDQLSYRLRQMIALLNEQPIDFAYLLRGVMYWNDDQKRTQNSWARDFYRNLHHEFESTSQEENAA